MAENNTGRHLLTEKDFVKVVDAEGNDLPPVPKHWGADQLPAGAEKKGRATSSRSATPPPPPALDPDAEPAGNASRDDWAAYAQKVKDAKPEDLVDDQGEDLGRDALREKYGTPAAE